MSTPEPDPVKGVLDEWALRSRRVRAIKRRSGGDTEETIGQLLGTYTDVGGVPSGTHGLYRVDRLSFDIYETDDGAEMVDGRVVVKLADGAELTVELA
jgi:hypothetical protein